MPGLSTTRFSDDEDLHRATERHKQRYPLRMDEEINACLRTSTEAQRIKTKRNKGRDKNRETQAQTHSSQGPPQRQTQVLMPTQPGLLPDHPFGEETLHRHHEKTDTDTSQPGL